MVFGRQRYNFSLERQKVCRFILESGAKFVTNRRFSESERQLLAIDIAQREYLALEVAHEQL